MEEQKFSVLARKTLAGIALVWLVLAPSRGWAQAPTAKQLFEQGVAAYETEDYDAAATAFRRSYELEQSIPVLFAWAQAEKNNANCTKAAELYRLLVLTADQLGEQNAQNVRDNLHECERIIVEAERLAKKTASQQAPPVKTAPPQPEPRDDGPRAWYADPLGGVLVASGVAALGVGIGYAVSARSANDKADSAPTELDFLDNRETANSRSKIAIASASIGGVLLTGGIIRYLTKKNASSEREPTLTGWVSGGAGGIFVRGWF